jgi:hypothetical protein
LKTIRPGVTDLITATTTSFFTCSANEAHHVERDVGLAERIASGDRGFR